MANAFWDALTGKSIKRIAELEARIDRLSEDKRLFQLAEAAAHVGHWKADFSNDELFWSNETFNIHGLPVGETPCLRDAIAFYHEDDQGLVADAVETARKSGQPFHFSARLIAKSGETRFVECVAQVYKTNDGRPAGIFGVLADRTDEVRLREELVEAKERASELVQAKAGFLAKMSHEIRTPMNGIVGFADLLLNDELSDTQRRRAELIASSGKALTMLLNDILDLSKIDAGKMEMVPAPASLRHIAEECLLLIEPQAVEKGLRVSLNVGPSVPGVIYTDALKTRQIISNLLSNAVKFTSRGSILLSIDASAQTVEVAVQDTGIGIEIEQQKQIFDAFTQEHSSTTASFGGTGLGLSISRNLAELLGGQLTLQSQKGVGSTFTLSLPNRVPVAGHAHVSMRSTEASPLKAPELRILMAEDYDINQLLAEGMADQLGLTLDIARDGVEAVEMVAQAAQAKAPYGLVFMDLQMPRLGGIEATRAIRAAGHCADNLPIVAVSANAFPEDVAACLDAGMQGHLAKPFTLEDFRDEIERWHSSKREAA